MASARTPKALARSTPILVLPAVNQYPQQQLLTRFNILWLGLFKEVAKEAIVPDCDVIITHLVASSWKQVGSSEIIPLILTVEQYYSGDPRLSLPRTTCSSSSRDDVVV